MNARAWLMVVALLAGLAVVLFVSARAHPDSLTPSSPGTDADVVVRMTNEGFNPARVTVKVGQRVRFVNDGADDRWPASNIHPTHAIYPRFDQKRPIVPGAQWTFAFDRRGIFRYHDHLAPWLAGVVTVE